SKRDWSSDVCSSDLIFHTRFNTFGEEHEVRVHQMLRNSDDWLIPLPYQYSGEIAKIVHLEDKDILGEYAMVNHGTKNSSEMLDRSEERRVGKRCRLE